MRQPVLEGCSLVGREVFADSTESRAASRNLEGTASCAAGVSLTSCVSAAAALTIISNQPDAPAPLVGCSGLPGGRWNASIVLALNKFMPTLTIRNVPARVVRSLKALARRRRRSMEQEIRELLEEHVAERQSVLEQIEAGWSRQTRRPTATEIDAWIGVGRP